MDLGLADRRAVVTAASSGLGLGAALALAREGAAVIIGSRSKENLSNATERIARESGKTPRAFPIDLTDSESIAAFIDDVRNVVGHIDILVTNTGGPPAKRFEECGAGDWDDAYRLLLASVGALIRGFLPGMRESGWGRIVCITSMAAKEPVENLVLSNSLRAAVTGLAKTLCRELAPDGILVNTVGPGFHDTPALERLIDKLIAQGAAGSRGEVLDGWCRDVPLNRIGDPEAFGRLVAFLASDACDYLTGQNVLVDGGRSRGTF